MTPVVLSVGHNSMLSFAIVEIIDTKLINAPICLQ